MLTNLITLLILDPRLTQSAGPAHTCKKVQRDLGLPAEAFEVTTSCEASCCIHCCNDSRTSRPATVPAYNSRRPHSRGGQTHLTEDDLQELHEVANIIEPLNPNTTTAMTLLHRGHRMSALEVVEEERTPGTTPSPSSYLPDIHQNQKVL